MCVVAVCLYMVCREDNSPHMLIDFSGACAFTCHRLIIDSLRRTTCALMILHPFNHTPNNSTHRRRPNQRLRLGPRLPEIQATYRAEPCRHRPLHLHPPLRRPLGAGVGAGADQGMWVTISCHRSIWMPCIHTYVPGKSQEDTSAPTNPPTNPIHHTTSRHPPTHPQVSNMALRLVASMQRDWIQAGRRPSGICGAALFLAAIYHDKPRTYKDVGRIVRVSPETIKRRVDGALFRDFWRGAWCMPNGWACVVVSVFCCNLRLPIVHPTRVREDAHLGDAHLGATPEHAPLGAYARLVYLLNTRAWLSLSFACLSFVSVSQ